MRKRSQRSAASTGADTAMSVGVTKVWSLPEACRTSEDLRGVLLLHEPKVADVRHRGRIRFMAQGFIACNSMQSGIFLMLVLCCDQVALVEHVLDACGVF